MDHGDDDVPPPPYSAVDPLQVHTDDSPAATVERTGLSEVPTSNGNNPTGHGNESARPGVRSLETSFSDMRIHDSSRRTHSASNVPTITMTTTATHSPQAESSATSRSTPKPTHFSSAASYFADRGYPEPSADNEKRNTLVHHLTIYARSQGKDFPRRPRCWRARATEISQHDWDTFLNFMFPASLGPAALSPHLHRRVRAEIERDRKDRPQETDDERRARLDAVITEWNDHFFSPRGTYVTWVYIADLERGPTSPLCPNCYPHATEASLTHSQPSRSPSRNAPIPVSTEQQPAYRIPRRPVPRNTYPSAGQEAQRAVSASATNSPTALGHQTTVPLTKHYQNTYTSAYPWSTNPVAWASQVSLRAQQYAEKITAQAQEYGRALEETALARSRQIEQYSRRLEDNAIARGRRLEEAALARSRKLEQAGDRLGNWATGMAGIGRRRASSNILHAYEEPDNLPSPSQNDAPARRLSTASNASSSSIGSTDSLSSIDSMSTTTELEPDDLAAMRAQLASLDGYHHRDLHSAAVSLRSHLRILQQTRRDSRFLLGRVGPRASGGGRSSWGRWDSPDDEKQREYRRVAMREETRLLREAFRQADRRAKQEFRELQRARRNRKLQRQQNQHHQYQHQLPRPGMSSLTIDRTMSNLELGTDKEVLMTAQEEGESNIPMHRPASYPVQTQKAAKEAAASKSTATTTTTTTTPPTAPTMNPHEAAKAWANAQRIKAKELQKANKNKIKENQQLYKEREKKNRKLAKKNKGKFGGGLTGSTSSSQIMLDSASSVSSLSLSTANLTNGSHLLSGLTDIPPLSRYPASTTSTAASVRSDPNTPMGRPSLSGTDRRRQRSESEVHAFELEGDSELSRR